ncbi:hypothetical protein [Kineosporia sp. A_224]|uniref:hypothetical protein n=1 Tax=Kineosporia sp. A_224 TaxID=1962180 RepID=UPI00117A9418|nr:hypothetical protein [Kineosporia sp. A_224]
MPWNGEDQVTQAFDEWKAVDADIRAYLLLSARWTQLAYATTWSESEREFSASFDPDRDDTEGHVDLFHRKVLGLWQDDYLWMLRSGALRDAVTAYEVYTEQSLSELMSRYVVTDGNGEKWRFAAKVHPGQLSPQWPTLRQIHKAIGIEIESGPVRYVRSLRHLLAHQRGRLRTEEQREAYAGEADQADWLIGEAYVGGDVPLSTERILAMMDDLAAAVRAADAVVWQHTWGRKGFPASLQDLAKKSKSPLDLTSVRA